VTPEELKNSILQLAIQGKLVEQRPEEGTVEELYQQIQAEKKRLIKEGKIKQGKPLPEVTQDDIPFDIPESWEWVRLGELGKVVGGGTPKTSIADYWDKEGIPWLTPADMKFFTGKYANYGKRNISALGLEKSSAQLMPKGTILYSSRAPIGYIAIAANDISTNQGFKSLVPVMFEINEFLYHCLIARTNDIVSRASGTTFKEISGTEFGLTILPLPPIEEQKRIVTKIEELLPYIDRYEQAWNELEELNKKFPDDLQKSILQLAIQGKLVEQRPEEGTAEELYRQIQAEKQRLFKEGKIRKRKTLPEIVEDEIPFNIPESWKWVRINDVVLDDLGGGTPSRQNEAYWNGDIPWMSVKDYALNTKIMDTLEKITEEGLLNSASNLIPANNVIVCTRVGLGKIAINSVGVAINQDLRALFLPDQINKDYFVYYYSTLNIRGTGTTVKGISRDKLLGFLISLPPLGEQRRIVAKIEELLPLCEKLKWDGQAT
jgi:type I restriction enzyme S subunit